jgi:hypothetical protein
VIAGPEAGPRGRLPLDPAILPGEGQEVNTMT